MGVKISKKPVRPLSVRPLSDDDVEMSSHVIREEKDSKTVSKNIRSKIKSMENNKSLKPLQTRGVYKKRITQSKNPHVKVVNDSDTTMITDLKKLKSKNRLGAKFDSDIEMINVSKPKSKFAGKKRDAEKDLQVKISKSKVPPKKKTKTGKGFALW
jgi:hypothetical protein